MTTVYAPRTKASLAGVVTSGFGIFSDSANGNKPRWLDANGVSHAFGTGGYSVYNPADYGTVDPTGVADSTTAFAAALAAMIAANVRAVFQIDPGVYKVAPGTIAALTTNPGIVTGADRGTTVLIPTAATGDMIQCPSGGDGFSVQNLAIYQTGSPQTAGAGVNTNSCNDVLIRNVLFVNLFQDVFIGANSIKVEVTHTVHSQTNGSATSVGIQVTNGAAGDTYIGPDVVMSNTGATRRAASVCVTQSGHFEVNQCNLTGSAQGLLINPGAGQIVADGFINYSLFDSCTVNGASITAPTSTSIVKSIFFNHAWFSGTTAGAGLAGLVTSGTAGGIIDGVILDHCRFLNNQQHGMLHQFGTDFRIDHPEVRGNGQQTANTYDGIQIAAGVSNWSIIGGKSGGTDQAPTGGNQRYGVNVIAGASTNYTIALMDLIGNSTAPLFDGGTGFGKVVKDNLPYLQMGGLPVTLGANFTAITAETLLCNTTAPANSLQVGTAIEFEAWVAGTQTAAAVTFTARLRIGPTTLTGSIVAVGGAVTPATARTTESFLVKGLFRITAVGATGAAIGGVETVGNFMALSTLLATAAVLAPVATVNTTVANLIELTLQPSAATFTAGQVLAAKINVIRP